MKDHLPPAGAPLVLLLLGSAFGGPRASAAEQPAIPTEMPQEATSHPLDVL